MESTGTEDNTNMSNAKGDAPSDLGYQQNPFIKNCLERSIPHYDLSGSTSSLGTMLTSQDIQEILTTSSTTFYGTAQFIVSHSPRKGPMGAMENSVESSSNCLASQKLKTSDGPFSNEVISTKKNLLNSPKYNAPRRDHTPRRQFQDSGISSLQPGSCSPLFKSPIRYRRQRSLSPEDAYLSSCEVTPVKHLNSSFSSLHSSAPAESMTQPSLSMTEFGLRTHTLQQALDESETRRQVLYNRLKEAQSTIELQARRLSNMETVCKDKSFENEDLKHKEKAYQHKINNLSKEKNNSETLKTENISLRTELQNRINGLEQDLLLCKTRNGVLETDVDKKQNVIDTINTVVQKMEIERQNKIRECDSLKTQLQEMKASLDTVKARSSWLENHTVDHAAELERLKKENQQLVSENSKLTKQLMELRFQNKHRKEENETLQKSFSILSEEKAKLLSEKAEFQKIIVDTQDKLSQSTCEKDRLFQEKMTLLQKNQTVEHDKECEHVLRVALEEQVIDLSAEVTRMTEAKERFRDEKKQKEEELKSLKFTNDSQLQDILTLNTKLDKALDQARSLEHGKSIAMQQHNIYEQEISSLEKLVASLKKSMDDLRNDHLNDKEGLDNELIALKDRCRISINEKEEAITKKNQLETKLRHMEEIHNDQLKREQEYVEAYKISIEQLKKTVTSKDEEIQHLVKSKNELTEKTSGMLADHKTIHTQAEELTECKEEMIRLREENRRLNLEYTENQQAIQLLEMQKNILTKTNEDNISLDYDKDRLTIKVEQLDQENKILRETVEELEISRNDLIQEKKDQLVADDRSFAIKTASKLEEAERHNARLETMNNRLKAEIQQLTKDIEKQRTEKKANERAKDERLETRYKELEEELSLQRQAYKDLEKHHHRLLQEVESDESNPDGNKDRTTMRTKLALLNDQLSAFEKTKISLNEELNNLKQKYSEDEKEFKMNLKDQMIRCQELEETCSHLSSSLQQAKKVQESQDLTIAALREQSLDEVSGELTQMRTELQKLMEVIQVKDQAIIDLEHQLRLHRSLVADKDRVIEQLQFNPNTEKFAESVVQQKIASLEKEKQDLRKRLKHYERLDFVNADNLDGKNNSLMEMNDLVERLRKDLKSKSRQIESLEEQLQTATRNDIKKLRRGDSSIL